MVVLGGRRCLIREVALRMQLQLVVGARAALSRGKTAKAWSWSAVPVAVAPRRSTPRLIQGYLAHKKHQPRSDSPRPLGIGLL